MRRALKISAWTAGSLAGLGVLLVAALSWAATPKPAAR